jgi:hypothetical protein
MMAKVEITGPYPISIETPDGLFRGEYVTYPYLDVPDDALGAVKVRDQIGRTKQTWIHPGSGVRGLAIVLLWELYRQRSDGSVG